MKNSLTSRSAGKLANIVRSAAVAAGLTASNVAAVNNFLPSLPPIEAEASSVMTREDAVRETLVEFPSLSETQRNYLQKALPSAVEAESYAQSLGVNMPAAAALAHSAIESRWGESGLTTSANNYFGIKCSKTPMPHANGCVRMKTREVTSEGDKILLEPFRTYDSIEASFMDYTHFLANSPRYAKVVKQEEPRDFLRELARSGYATEPKMRNILLGNLRQVPFEEIVDAYKLKISFQKQTLITQARAFAESIPKTSSSRAYAAQK